VLPEPPPQAFFMGYGDSAITCTLFAWPDHFHHWLQVKSDLTAAVYEAVSAAGMSFPLPQRAVRMLHETEVPQARETLPHAVGGGATEERRQCEDSGNDTTRTG
jgi:small-conductance mechanosensitive channel